MKFTLKHLFWLVTISAVFCLGLSYSVKMYNEANIQAEAARQKAEQARRDAIEKVEALHSKQSD